MVNEIRKELSHQTKKTNKLPNFNSLEIRLIKNLFLQIQKYHRSTFEVLDVIKIHFPQKLKNEYSLFRSIILHQEKKPQKATLFKFNQHLKNLLIIFHDCMETMIQESFNFKLHDISVTLLTKINVRNIYQATLNFFSKHSTKQENLNHSLLLSNIPKKRHYPLILNLAEKYKEIESLCHNIQSSKLYNQPNISYSFTLKNKTQIRVFRMESPDELPHENKLNPTYRAFITHYVRYNLRHMDVSLLSTKFPEEKKAVKIRMKAGEKFINNIFAWNSDIYSDLIGQQGKYRTKETFKANNFKKIIYSHILLHQQTWFLPIFLTKTPAFHTNLDILLDIIHKDIFYNKETFNINDRRDFCLFTIIYLIEYFCLNYRPQTLTTSCRAHIDRGMMVNTLLYSYAIVKSEQINHGDFKNYLPLLIFPPAILFANRPPYDDVMNRLLSALSRLFDPKVQKNVQKRKSFFNTIKVWIPKPD